MGIGHGEANMLNPINIIKGRMGEWVKPTLLSRIKPFFLNRYKVFQFSGVDYGGREADRPSSRGM